MWKDVSVVTLKRRVETSIPTTYHFFCRCRQGLLRLRSLVSLHLSTPSRYYYGRTMGRLSPEDLLYKFYYQYPLVLYGL